MLRGSFTGHRRYSITHRAVQRLRELAQTVDEVDDEALRDQLDDALGAAEDAGLAVRTLDAMLGEPQVLIPVDAFGDPLYSIIKEDTVVTVLPRSHGEEILQRGQALEQRVAAGQLRPPERDDREEGGDRWDAARRRQRRDLPGPVVLERHRGPGLLRGTSAGALGDQEEGVVSLEARRRPDDPVAGALHDALERGRRRAAVAALREVIEASDRDDALLPLWNELARQGIPQSLTVGDLASVLGGGSPNE